MEGLGSILLDIFLCCKQDIIVVAELIKVRVFVQGADEVVVHVRRPVEIRQNQPAHAPQLGVTPDGKPDRLQLQILMMHDYILHLIYLPAAYHSSILANVSSNKVMRE